MWGCGGARPAAGKVVSCPSASARRPTDAPYHHDWHGVNRDVSKAKRQARHGPVVITSRGKAEHVLLSMEAYVALTRQEVGIVDSLAMPEAADVDFEPPRLQVGAYRPATLGECVGHVLYAGSRMGGWR